MYFYSISSLYQCVRQLCIKYIKKYIKKSYLINLCNIFIKVAVHGNLRDELISNFIRKSCARAHPFGWKVIKFRNSYDCFHKSALVKSYSQLDEGTFHETVVLYEKNWKINLLQRYSCLIWDFGNTLFWKKNIWGSLQGNICYLQSVDISIQNFSNSFKCGKFYRWIIFGLTMGTHWSIPVIDTRFAT